MFRKISKILVCIDGSKESVAAGHYSISLAKKYNARLISLSVVLFPVISNGRLWDARSLQELREEGISQAESYLKLISENARKNGVQLDKTKVIEGSVPTVHNIVNYAEKENVDLIVIGTKGRSGFKKQLLGSVALGVVTYAHCPVIVVR